MEKGSWAILEKAKRFMRLEPPRTLRAEIVLLLPRNHARKIDLFNDRCFERLIFFPCFRRNPNRCAQENEVLDKELAGIPKHWKPVRKMERSRSGK